MIYFIVVASFIAGFMLSSVLARNALCEQKQKQENISVLLKDFRK